ncbi:T-cell surface glycoprotein CD1a-like isoform X2 [Mustela nigripes]|uniref:T-cell surface glycoprotein CD1a-like isoform X2 n=1 Tax=Mustela nigripes TaxID=77151 RepID=UPI002815318A|nr:T-cell surface glycoprotein CD1a-like isoform X2 [Mustela nigripes]
MLFLQLVLLVVLLSSGDNENDFQETSFQIILTTSFYNDSWTQKLGSAWLDELQTHGWDSDSGNFTCLWPWSKGNFSNKELMEEERSFHTFSIRFPLIFQDHFSEWQLEYPFQVQTAKGCELHFGEPSVGFMRIAYQGSDLVIFQNKSWWPSPKGGRRAQLVSRLFNQYHVINVRLQTHISDTCPRFLLGLLDAGKTHLKRQGVLGCESHGGFWRVMLGETQQSRRPGHGPLLGEASTHRLGLPGSDSAPGASGSSHLVALETQENSLETSMHWPPTGMRNQQPRDQDILKPSSAVMSLQPFLCNF